MPFTRDAQADGSAGSAPDVDQVLESVDGASTKVNGHTTGSAAVVGSADYEVVDAITAQVPGARDARIAFREGKVRDRVGR